jgi:hypothetical protein
MPIAVNLQPAGQPGGNPDIAKPQFFIEEIEVVVQTLALIGLQESLAADLVVPRA